MAVEEDRGRSLRTEPIGIDDRVSAGLNRADILHADPLQLLDRPLGTATNVGRVLRQRTDTWNREIGLQLVDVLVAVGVDEVDDVVHNRSILSPSRSALRER